MTDPLDQIAHWREITEAATEGPWVVGEHDHIQGASYCQCLPDYGPLVWEGKRDINGTTMLTHIHRKGECRWEDDTSIYSTALPHPEVVALSTSEYATIAPENARFIATAKSEMVPALLTAVENVLKLHECRYAFEGDLDYCEICVQHEGASWPCSTVTAIRDALGGAQ